MVWLYIPSSFVPASECSERVREPHSSILESDIEPFATWSAKPLPLRSLSRLWRREPSIRRLSGLTFSRSTAQHGADAWIASLPDSRVRTYPSPGGALDSTASDRGFSSTFWTLPTIAVRGSSFWRTSQASLLPPPPLWTRPESSSKSVQRPASWENWPTEAGMRNGRIFARPTLAQAISANAGSASRGAWLTPCGMTGVTTDGRIGAGGEFSRQVTNWATPDANATERTNRSSSAGATERPTLALAARGWATPRATDGTKGGPNQRGSAGDQMLPSMAAQWATPTSSENSNRTTKMAPSHGNGHGVVLAGQACSWPTPMAADDGSKVTETSNQPGLIGAAAQFSRQVHSIRDGRELSPTVRTLRPRLNPAFACWLMGWPIWWTNPGITSSVKSEMESYRYRLRSQFSSLLGEPGFSREQGANMATNSKNSKDVYGAKGKTNTLFFDPEDLTLVDDPAHPLYDERVHMPINESMVLNIMFQGVLQAIEVNKNPETSDIEVVMGRQRVRNAREANRRLIAQGKSPVLVPANVRKVGRAQRALDLSAATASENAIRQQETPMTTAAKMARQVNMGRVEADIAVIFGCNVATVRSTLALLDCCEAVQKAVDSGDILVTHARALAKVSPTEQRAKVRELKEAAVGKSGHARSRAQRAVMDSGAARMRSKAEIRAELEKVAGERADTLRWVLGLDGQPPGQQAADSRQMHIEGAA